MSLKGVPDAITILNSGTYYPEKIREPKQLVMHHMVGNQQHLHPVLHNLSLEGVYWTFWHH